MSRVYFYFAVAMILFPTFGKSQKTFFLRTERDSQTLVINSIPWNRDAFFTVKSNDPIYQVRVEEKFFKTEYDILHEKTNYEYSTTQEIFIDPAQLAKVKIVQLDYVDSIEVAINTMDYATYQKDLMHDGQLTKNFKTDTSLQVFKKLRPSAVYINSLANDFHEETIGRYKIYVGGNIENIDIYKIEIDKNLCFIQILADVNWSFANQNMEMFGNYNHAGRSGKFAFNETVTGTKNYNTKNIDSALKMSFENALNLAIHDAILSSYLYFLDENQEKFARTN